MIIKYTIEKCYKLGDKVKGNYVVWCESKSENGYGVKGVFQGTKKECKEYLETLKGE